MKNELLIIATIVSTCFISRPAFSFEGRIHAAGGRTGAVAGLLYTVGTNCLRVEMTATNFPYAFDVVDLNSGQITLIQPMNRTFLRFKPASQSSAVLPPGFPAGPGGLPPGVGPRIQPGNPVGAPATPPGLPPGIGPTNLPGMPAMPAVLAPPGGLPQGVGPQTQPPMAPGAPAVPNMPVMPQNPGMGSMPAMPMMPPGGGLELQATGGRTNLLGYACERYEIKGHGEMMEIWATDQLVPFQVYLHNQPPRFGPPMIEEQWAGLLAAKKLFPLSAVLRMDNGVERYRFDVQSITPGELTKDDVRGFQPPEGYVEIQPRPF